MKDAPWPNGLIFDLLTLGGRRLDHETLRRIVVGKAALQIPTRAIASRRSKSRFASPMRGKERKQPLGLAEPSAVRNPGDLETVEHVASPGNLMRSTNARYNLALIMSHWALALMIFISLGLGWPPQYMPKLSNQMQNF